ncbi:MAG: 4Fe-4S dicluster domain-containing protein [Candidatus Omnitrophica bacterium]|nr:4Fe-4S dicluster domain-containing protein [Candidatus Omnitrophota bacterium]
MRYPKIRELKEVIRALIKGPFTSDFPRKPHKPFERFRGRPYFHEEDCVGCTACAQVCPTKAIEVVDEIKGGKARRVLIVHWDICIFCGQCQANCLTQKGIKLSQEFDFATTESRQDLFNRVEKELMLCECCGEIIVPVDQYKWVADRLGPLCFSNASLILFYLRNLGAVLKTNLSSKKETVSSRADRIKVLCPSCRRDAVVKS